LDELNFNLSVKEYKTLCKNIVFSSEKKSENFPIFYASFMSFVREIDLQAK